MTLLVTEYCGARATRLRACSRRSPNSRGKYSSKTSLSVLDDESAVNVLVSAVRYFVRPVRLSRLASSFTLLERCGFPAVVDPVGTVYHTSCPSPSRAASARRAPELQRQCVVSNHRVISRRRAIRARPRSRSGVSSCTWYGRIIRKSGVVVAWRFSRSTQPCGNARSANPKSKIRSTSAGLVGRRSTASKIPPSSPPMTPSRSRTRSPRSDRRFDDSLDDFARSTDTRSGRVLLGATIRSRRSSSPIN